MASRRRFWDNTVLAAALTASVAGLTAAVGSWLDFSKTQVQIKHENDLAKCDAANQFLKDEAINPDLSRALRSALIAESVEISRFCSRRR
jgi:hypothetical protein